MRIMEIAAVRPSWDSPRIHALLRREGWLVNHKHPEQPYRMEGLNLSRIHLRRRKTVLNRGPSAMPTRRGKRWSMCFCHDQLEDDLCLAGAGPASLVLAIAFFGSARTPHSLRRPRGLASWLIHGVVYCALRSQTGVTEVSAAHEGQAAFLVASPSKPELPDLGLNASLS